MEITQRLRSSSHENLGTSFQQIKTKAMRLSQRPSLQSLDSTTSKRSSTNSSKLNETSQHGTSIFQRLPQSIYDAILGQLEELHSDNLSPSCATCYMRDLVALQLTNRSWDRGVRKALYSKIHIAGHDCPAQLKKYKMKMGTRLKLLRRTLRERRMLSSLVNELAVPDPAIPAMLTDGRPNPHFLQYQHLVASVVLVCPNLERLQGLHAFYNHEFDRLTHALSTRPNLKEHTWIISENEAITQRSYSPAGQGLMDADQIFQFMHYHAAWSKLETLMFCSLGGMGVLEHALFVKVFRLLPELKHLCISCFDRDDFKNETLSALPPLTSLRLEECSGVTETGLAQWAATRPAQSLESLSLIRQNLEGLLHISKIFGSLSRLLRFTVVQPRAGPTMPDDLMPLQPIMASRTLQHLHWEVGLSGQFPSAKYHGELPPSSRNMSTANSHLASSILHGGFPSLINLRAPQDLDPPGVLQAACCPTPNASILLPADMYGLAPNSQGGKPSMPDPLPVHNSLYAARIRAQSYIDAAGKSGKDFCKIVVTDHSDSDRPRHESSSTESSVSTAPTDPADLFSDSDDPLLNTGADRPLSITTPSSIKVSAAIMAMLEDTKPKTSIPLTRRIPPAEPPKLREYTFRPFLGRISVSVAAPGSPVLRPPRFNLLPDVPEYDAEGGVIGWADLLKFKEKADRAVNGPAWIKDGCTGDWNRGSAGGPNYWRHTERERRTATTIGIQHFF